MAFLAGEANTSRLPLRRPNRNRSVWMDANRKGSPEGRQRGRITAAKIPVVHHIVTQCLTFTCDLAVVSTRLHYKAGVAVALV